MLMALRSCGDYQACLCVDAQAGYICGKRLSEYIKETLPILERFNEIKLDESTKEKLIRVSPATIDRLLKKEKEKYRLKNRGRSLTKPGTLLKHQIPIRTFAGQ